MVDKVVTDTIEEELEQDENLIFTIKSQEFGIKAVRVKEISRVLPITDVPNAPSYIEGIMNLRGRLASVINFRKKLGFEHKEHDEDTRVIIVELGAFPVGIIVDAVEEVVKIPDESVQELPESTITSVSRDYMTGVGMLDKRLIILLDLDKVLTSTEVIELGEINRIAEEVEEAPEPVESEEMADKAGEAPGAAKGEEIVGKVDEAPEPVENNKTKTKQPIAAVSRQAKRRSE